MKRKQSSSSSLQNLHTDGYIVYNRALDLSNSNLQQLKKKAEKAHRIFNTSKNDGRRGQINIPRNLMTQAASFLQTRFPNHVQREWNILRSKPGCKTQMAHCDYVPDQALAQVNDEETPLGAVIAVMPGSKLRIWSGSHRLAVTNPEFYGRKKPILPVDLELEPGDIVVFRGDLVHAGASYQEENIRVHVYLDHDAVPRTRNRTWVIKKDANDKMKKLILEI